MAKDKTPRQIAEEAMPGWKAIEQRPVDAPRNFGSDATGVDLEALRRRYLPDSAGRAFSLGADRAAAAPTGDHSDFVVMAPKSNLDSPAARKTVLVRNKTVIGSQG